MRCAAFFMCCVFKKKKTGFLGGRNPVSSIRRSRLRKNGHLLMGERGTSEGGGGGAPAFSECFPGGPENIL